MTEDRIRAHVFVSGTVQGVRYRASTRDAARQREVAGWVRNLDDGRVEAVFEGSEESVEGMIEWCHTGSAMASVDDVDVSYEDPGGESGFRVRW
jgi:acylphosphatase